MPPRPTPLISKVRAAATTGRIPLGICTRGSASDEYRLRNSQRCATAIHYLGLDTEANSHHFGPSVAGP
jgi:hypothetical protein